MKFRARVRPVSGRSTVERVRSGRGIGNETGKVVIDVLFELSEESDLSDLPKRSRVGFAQRRRAGDHRAVSSEIGVINHE